ncbi:MAG: hypothetical protein ACFFD4_17425, partial [Candidatus Odinarchaeota archaeon]
MRFQGKYAKAVQLIDEVTGDRTLGEQERIDFALDKCSILVETGKHTGALLIIDELLTLIKDENYPLLLFKASTMKAEALR